MFTSFLLLIFLLFHCYNDLLESDRLLSSSIGYSSDFLVRYVLDLCKLLILWNMNLIIKICVVGEHSFVACKLILLCFPYVANLNSFTGFLPVFNNLYDFNILIHAIRRDFTILVYTVIEKCQENPRTLAIESSVQSQSLVDNNIRSQPLNESVLV